MGEPFENVKFQFRFTAQPDATYVSNPVKSKAIESFIFNPKEHLSKAALENLLNGKEQDDYTNKKQALELYNGSPIKKKYAQAVMNNINVVRETANFNTSA